MGVCFSAQVKTENADHSGLIDKYEGADASETDSTSNGSKVSSSFPVTPILCSESEIVKPSDLKSFTFNDLKLATKNFRPENALGENGSGSVFKGWVNEDTLAARKPTTGIIVAIKRMKNESSHGLTQWLAEVHFLRQLDHPNLVKLVGYCIEDEERVLVNEFAPRGSFENHLFRRGSYFQPLSWNLRLKVALGAAKGLAFLHSPEVNLVHNDFKTSSILLDLKYNAKLTDFGMPKCMDQSSDDDHSLAVHRSSRNLRTSGYAAPEYKATGHLFAKSNVYSFGVILVEMICGRRAIDNNRPRNEINLIEWAKPYLANKTKIGRILDNRLDGQYTIDAVRKAATIALKCLSIDPMSRPTMDHVAKLLEELYDPSETSPSRSKPTRRRSTEISAHVERNSQ